MGIIKSPPLANPFFAIMFNYEYQYSQVINRIVERYGDTLDTGPVYKVSNFTNYYEKEFGAEANKRMIVLRKPVDLEGFHKVKIWSNQIEDLTADLIDGVKFRTVNVDPGFLDPSKLSLYSTKNFSHRVYVGDGIYAEVTLIYAHGKFKILDWTYPDYRCEENIKFLLSVRRKIVDLKLINH